jgi:hypothetical protein
MKTRKNKLLAVAALFSSLSFAACAHKAIEREVDQKVDQRPAVPNAEALDAHAKEHIEDTPGLTDLQRKELTELRQKTRAEMNSLQEKALKLKALALENAIGKDHNHAELQVIKKQIRKLEERRVTAFFDAIDKSLKILDREPPRSPIHRDWIMRDLLLERPNAPSL